MRPLAASVAALLPLLWGDPASSQDAAAGEMQFKACTACHAIGPGAINKIGPELNGLDGRKAGSIEGFGNYSPAMKASGIIWDHAHFLDYIQNPRKVIPDNRMAFVGVSKPKAAEDLWAYLSQFQADGSKK